MKKLGLYLILLFILFSSVEARDTFGCIRNFRNIELNFSFGSRFIGKTTDFGVGGQGAMSVMKINSKPKIVQLNTKDDLNYISFIDDLNGFIVGEKGTILFTGDAGKTWVEQDSKTTESLNSIYCLNQKNCWIAGSRGTVLTTANGGKSWDNPGSGQSNSLFSIAFISKSKGWAVGGWGTVLQTIDGGKSWQKVEKVDFPATNMLNQGGTRWQTIRFFTKSFGCFAGANRIVCTFDGGKSWKKTEMDESKDIYNFTSFSTFRNKPVLLEECGVDFISPDLGKTWVRK